MGTFYEFFAGGGMARAGLGDDWTCLFANDIDPKKAASYVVNWGDDHLKVADVARITTSDLPGIADLAWASFPCQDLSLAGAGAGLKGKRSGTFWPFWRLMQALADERRRPRMICLENVCGALTSHEGKDFAAIGEALADAKYKFGAVVIDAVHFLPQSRPRLFIVAVRDSTRVPAELVTVKSSHTWHPPALIAAHQRLSESAKKAWVWWKLPLPAARKSVFADIIEENPSGVTWHTKTETQRLLAMMNAIHLAKVEEAKSTGSRMVGAIYKRTRLEGQDGVKVQRAEVRFDDVAGCLRTPLGGSSRQSVLIVEGKTVRSRLLSPREAARLMGLPDDYRLPANYNEAYHLAGDGLAVPAVRFLAEHILGELLMVVKVKKAA